MWECHSQDFRGWRESAMEKMPPKQVEKFATKEEAERAKKSAQALGLTACVVAQKPPRARKQKAEDFNKLRAGWKLHR